MFSKEGCSVYPIMVPTGYGLRSFNFYVVEHGNSLSLLDAGIDSEECWQALIRTLNEHDFTLQDVSQVIITHNHQDHIGLINRLTSIREVPVYAPEQSIYRLKRDKQFFSLRVQFYERLYQEMGCKEAGEQQVEKLRRAMQENEKDKIVAEIIPINESDLVAGLRVIDTPGHSPDHVVFWDEQRKWLFVGDHLISHISSNALVEPDQHGRRLPTLITYIDSLKKCIEIDAEILFPGHGELIYDHRSLISARLNRIEEKAEKLAAHIANGVSTASQLAQIFYKDKYNSQFSLVMSEIIGLIDYLEAQQKIQTELKHGVWCLTAV